MANDHTQTADTVTKEQSFHLAELLERCMGSADLALLLLSKLEQQVRTDAPLIAAHAAVMNLDEVARIAHALKGAAGAVAATPLHDAAARVESEARQSLLTADGSTLAMLQTEAERCLSQLSAARRGLDTTAATAPEKHDEGTCC